MTESKKDPTDLYRKVKKALCDQKGKKEIDVNVIFKPYVINFESPDEESVIFIFRKYKQWVGEKYESQVGRDHTFRCPRREIETSPQKFIDNAIQEMDRSYLRKKSIKRMKE